MCELLLTSVIVGFVNVGPNKYVVQGLSPDGKVLECEMLLRPKKNDRNVLTLFTI